MTIKGESPLQMNQAYGAKGRNADSFKKKNISSSCNSFFQCIS